MDAELNGSYAFGEFEVDTSRRRLRRQGSVVDLKPKSFELLLALVENRGTVVSKADLLDRVWENQFVEENNLTVHVAALRKALGETKNDHRYIVTVPGKGYSFVAELNGHSEREIIVETRTSKKIVVNEEVEEFLDESVSGNCTEPRIEIARRTAPVTSRAVSVISRRAALIVGALLLILGALVIGGYALRDRLASGLFGGGAPFEKYEVKQLTTNGKVGNAALSPDGKLFAYVIDDLGVKSLWLGNVEGGSHLQLRPPAEGTYTTLSFSADSSSLYYSLRDEKNPKRALYRINALGGVATKLKDEITSFAVSADGTQIAWERRDAENDVVVVSAIDGSQARDLAVFPRSQSGIFASISWSPDGGRLALSVQRGDRIYRQELAFIDVRTGAVERLELKDFREITNTAWTKDGSGLVITAIEETSHSSVPQYRLVYVSYPDGAAKEITADRSNYGASWHNDSPATLSLDAAGRSILAVEHRQLSNVWVAPADDLANARQITFGSFGRYDGLWGLDWTPDGRIIYTTSDTRSQYLAEMNADGSDQRPLTDPGSGSGHVDSVLTVSSDGRYILFHSNRTNGEFDIWRSDIDGSNPKQLTFGGKNLVPAPSPDGRWVYYKSYLDGIGRLCRVPMDGGSPECVTDKETTWGSFSPDGNYFAAHYMTDKARLAIFSGVTHELIRQFDLSKTGTMYMGSRWTPDGKAVTYRDNGYGYWIQPIDGGAPTRLDGLPKEKLYNFSWSKDGKWLAFVRGQEIRDVILLQADL